MLIRHRVRRHCALALFVAAVASSSVPALARDPARQVDRARAEWMVDTPAGRARYVVEVQRVTGIGPEPATTGFMATRVCLPPARDGERICIAAADLKRIHDHHFVMDPTLDRANFKMWFGQERHSATWDASEGLPEVSLERLEDGDATVERGASADGVAFGTSLAIDGVEEATVERGVDSDMDPPPAPGSLLPGFGRSFATSSSCWKVRPKERGFTRAMNAARSKRGLGRMRLDPELSKAARVHTRRMITDDLLHHTPSATLRRRVTNWVVLGENVGVGGTVSSLHAAFMASPPHRENILHGPFRHVGVGTSIAAGQLWVTVIFEARKNPGTRLRMPSC